MKFVEGRAVDAILEQQGALPVPVILQILLATAGALAFAHERQIVHRDIKGANILVDRDGRVLVSDFGIARAAEEKTLTASGSVIGTPHFMSPEQCAGQKVGPQSDQYSLGVLAFQMLTGQVPFDAESVIAIIQHHYFTPVPDVRAVREGVPEELLAVVYRSLSKDAGQRYASTRDMVKAIEAVPFPPEDKSQSEDTLRDLARGEAIPKVRTGSLPPLADARTIGASALGPLSPTIAGGPTVTAPSARPSARPRKHGRTPLIATLVALVVLGAAAAWLALRGTGPTAAAPGALASPTGVQPAGAESTATATPGPVPPSATVARPSSDSTANRTGAGVAARRAPARTQAPAEGQATPAPEPAGTGLLRVRTVPPSALILVDGRRVGEPGSAFDVEVPAGRRRIRITAPGYVAFDTTITVENGGTRNLGQIILRSEGGP
jgi:serine/threonine-protein kinase